MMRLFVAVEIPAEVRQGLASLQDRLRHAQAAARSPTSQDAEPTIASSPVIGTQNNAWRAGCNSVRWSAPRAGRFWSKTPLDTPTAASNAG